MTAEFISFNRTVLAELSNGEQAEVITMLEATGNSFIDSYGVPYSSFVNYDINYDTVEARYPDEYDRVDGKEPEKDVVIKNILEVLDEKDWEEA